MDGNIGENPHNCPMEVFRERIEAVNAVIVMSGAWCPFL